VISNNLIYGTEVIDKNVLGVDWIVTIPVIVYLNSAIYVDKLLIS